MDAEHTFVSQSPDQTAEFGRRLATTLAPGDVVALIGPLGAGKTLLARSIVAALGGDERAVSSPTFALIHEYAAHWPVYHFDAYRLENERAFAALGVDEYFSGQGICLVEWADRVPGTLPAKHWRVTIEIAGETSRTISISEPDA